RFMNCGTIETTPTNSDVTPTVFNQILLCRGPVMKRMLTMVIMLSLFGAFESVQAQTHSELTQPPNGKCERAEVSQWIGLVKITIEYHSPKVHGPNGVDRTGHIWGEFIPYGLFDQGFGPSTSTPWRVGANESTTVTVSHDVKVEGKELKAGTYALFLLLEKDGPWTWIFSRNATGWGSFHYDPKEDALRVRVNPQTAPDTEFLTFGFDERLPDSAVAYLQWENKRIPFKIEVPDVNQLYVAQMRKDLQGWAGFSYENWRAAAQFCADNKINLDEALVWADKAITEPFRNAVLGQKDFFTLGTKAAVLEAMGKTSEADATMDIAVRVQGTAAQAVYQYCMRLLATGRNQRAMEFATIN